MKYRNTTSVPDTLLREVIRFACPSSVSGFSIWFKRAGGGTRTFFAGAAYWNRKHIVCRIPARFERLKRPYVGAGAKPGRGYLPWPAYTFEEALVALVAHECNHLAQAKNARLYRRTWGARGRFSERDCDAYAIKMLRKWRAEHNGTAAKAAKLRDPAKPKPLTPEQRLEALAAPYGVQVSIDHRSGGIVYWVNAPESLCDADGEMKDDPYCDEHYHDDYASAKEAIETYIAAAIAHRASSSLTPTPTSATLPT